MTLDHTKKRELDRRRDLILHYDDFQVWHIKDAKGCWRYFYYEAEDYTEGGKFPNRFIPKSIDSFEGMDNPENDPNATEVRLIGDFSTNIVNIDKRNDDLLDSLMECYCCGERVTNNGIYYLYFDVVPKFDIIDEPH